jgi:hypothetical protein
MTTVVVASVKQTGTDGDAPVEELVLDPASVTLTFKPIMPDGSAGTAIMTTYNCTVG